MIRVESALTSASVSISDPRAMLTIHVCGFITHSSGAPIRCCVSSVAGAHDDEVVGLAPDLADPLDRDRPVAPGAGDGEDLHVVRLEPLDQRAADAARADHRDRRARELAARRCGSHDQARAYWLKLRMPAISSPSACSATWAA